MQNSERSLSSVLGGGGVSRFALAAAFVFGRMVRWKMNELTTATFR